MKYLVFSFSLSVGKGKKKKTAPWSFLFVDFGISLESASRYSFFYVALEGFVSSLPSHKANSGPRGSPSPGQKGGELAFFQAGSA